MNTISDVWRKFTESRRYRSAFARDQFKRLVPFQIQALRKQRGWSQSDLAENADLTQGVISRAEDQDYGNLTVNTILNIAKGFDVAFIGQFVPFSELAKWYVSLSQTTKVPSFDEENAAGVMNVVAQPNVQAVAQDEAMVFRVSDTRRFGNTSETPLAGIISGTALTGTALLDAEQGTTGQLNSWNRPRVTDYKGDALYLYDRNRTQRKETAA